METLLERKNVRLDADGATLRVSGSPDFDDASELARAGRHWLGEQSGSVSFDACGVDRVSSAMLSVLLEWMRSAREGGTTIDTISLSEQLRELVELADLGAVFPAGQTVC